MSVGDVCGGEIDSDQEKPKTLDNTFEVVHDDLAPKIHVVVEADAAESGDS